jgi:antitoxin HicB
MLSAATDGGNQFMAASTKFPYSIERLASGSFRARFPGFPEFQPEAPSIEKLIASLQDALLPVLEARLKNGTLPAERELRPGEELLTLSPTYSAKLQLIEAAKRNRVTAAELSRRLGCLPQEAARILRLTHPTKIDTIAAAAAVFGGRLTCRIDFPDEK